MLLTIGPPFLPLIGSGFSIKMDRRDGIESPPQFIHRLAKKYGPVMRMRLGTNDYIYLSGKDSQSYLSEAIISWTSKAV